MRNAQVFIDGLYEWLKEAFHPVNKRISELEQRVQAVERSIKEVREVTYKGTWKDGDVYSKGNMVTMSGCVWACMADRTIERPGNGSSDWRLAVKSGRDGKDARP